MADALDPSARKQRLSFAAALDVVAAVSGSEPAETVPLAAALGRVTAGPVMAVSDYPRFDMSAMDGVAFAAADASGATASAPVMLPMAGEARAGAPAPNITPRGACRISTGAKIPDGLDTVLAREVVEIEGPNLVIRQAQQAGRNVRKRGEDAQAGETVIPAGQILTPADLGALTCYGVSAVAVARLPKIALLSTGDELAYPGNTPRDHQIYDANGVMIRAIAQSLGLPVECYAAVGDDRTLIHETLRQASQSDASIVISSGGVSVGDHDHLPDALGELGARVHFHGVAMRPGKPVLFAVFPNGTLFFGLPGNPVAALLGCRFFVTAAVRGRLGLPRETGEAIDLDYPSKVGTTLLLKAKRHRLETGASRIDILAEIDILADQRSHTMRPLIDANCWVRVEDGEGRLDCSLYPLSPSLE